MIKLILAFMYFILIFLLIFIGSFIYNVNSEFKSDVNKLLDESGDNYEIKACFGGWLKKELYCQIIIPNNQIQGFLVNLGLDKESTFYETKRIVYIDDGKDPCSNELRDDYSKYFDEEIYNPSRHGFNSAILFYNNLSDDGCLYLSIE
jgi:hypothetical protein